jgi:glutathione S-transferase
MDMPTLRLLHLHTSPFSERVRWALDHKGLRYEREPYVVASGEARLLAETGQSQVPVLFVDGAALPDSTAIVEWIEAHVPEPRLVPQDATEAAEVRLYEELGNAVLAPEGRQLVLGRMLGASSERIAAAGRFMAGKYGHSVFAERRAREVAERALGILAARLSGGAYLVGNRFTRADLTVAASLLDVAPPGDELFACEPAWMRGLMTDAELAGDARFARVFAWRDRMYREHRGRAGSATLS